jgi:hypothetical protein
MVTDKSNKSLHIRLFRSSTAIDDQIAVEGSRSATTGVTLRYKASQQPEPRATLKATQQLKEIQQ